MVERIVRIYPSEIDSMIIGFSASCSAIPEDHRFTDFMTERAYELKDPAPIKPKEAKSYRYVESRPPLSDEHIQELGSLCVEFMEPFALDIKVMDEREDPPRLVAESSFYIDNLNFLEKNER
jgi:hypothetical protein